MTGGSAESYPSPPSDEAGSEGGARQRRLKDGGDCCNPEREEGENLGEEDFGCIFVGVSGGERPIWGDCVPSRFTRC
jgi:hypothetical protein